MPTGRAHPVTHALMVAYACAGLALEAVTRRSFPTAHASTLSVAAKEAAARLGKFLSARGEAIDPHVLRVVSLAQVDLEAVAQIASLAVTHEFRLRDAAYIAQSARYTADQAIRRLTFAEEMMGI